MKALRHELDVFAEAAELDRDRVRRWAHFQVVQAAFHGRRHRIRPRPRWAVSRPDHRAGGSVGRQLVLKDEGRGASESGVLARS